MSSASSSLQAGSRLGLIVVMLGVVALATFTRFHDLGGAPLAEDEYYTTRGIEWIIATGLPAIPDGGYYTRGLLFQYLAAGAARLFGADAFAYRLPAAIFGLLLSITAFFYARRFAGIAVGLTVAVLLLLSSWEVEFSRFIRFYTLFQVIVLLYLIALDKAYFEARASWRYVPHAVLLLGGLAHELAILLAPLLFLPLLPACTRLRLGSIPAWLSLAVVSLIVTVLVGIISVGIDTSNYGVVDRYPADYGGYVLGAASPLALPSLPFFRLLGSPFQHILALGLIGAVMVALFLAQKQWGGRRFEWPDLLLALALLAAVSHLFATVGLLLVWAVARYDLWRLTTQPPRRLVMLGLILAIMAGWAALALAMPERLLTPEVVRRWQMDVTEPGELGAILRALWSTFFGLPDLYRTTLRPFATELPELALVLVVALVWFVIAHRHDAIPELLRHPGIFVIYWALIMALFSVGDSTSRYWFPLLPVIYTFIAVSLVEAFTRFWPQAVPAARRGACAVTLALFMLGPDFNPRHLLDVGNDVVRYRTGPYSHLEETWYPRPDVRTAAATVEAWRAERPDARIVVENLPALSHYMRGPHAIYFARDYGRFASYSRDQGRRERWSGERLLSTPQELVDYAQPAEELWLVRSIDPSTRPPGIDLAADLVAEGFVETERVVASVDGRIEVIRLRNNAMPQGAATVRP
jgi:hypothetical protein